MKESVILEVKDLYVNFRGESVLSNISFSLKKGYALAIVGPNGAGKSTLFRALLGLVPYRGTISWEKGVKIGYVPQKLAVERDLPLSVYEFLGFRGRDPEIAEAFNAVGIHDDSLRDRQLGALSGGELQRVLVAFAIMGNPDVLLFDEPVAGIDLGGEETIYNLLLRLHKEKGLTIVLISHDLDVVYRYADEVLCLNKKLVCFGRPEEALTSESLKKLYGDSALFHHTHKQI